MEEKETRKEENIMYRMYLSVYLVVSLVSAAPLTSDNFVNFSSEGTIDDMDGSCGFNFTSSDTNKARNTFNDYIYDKTVSVVYMSLQEKCLDQTNLNTYLSEETERNGLQEWIWLRKEMRYEELSLPIDLDSLTFTITKYGTRQMDIPWSLSISCNLNSRISYENETKHILNYLWSSITQNETGSLLCHRSFDDKTLRGTTAIWYITTVWIGYDFDCYLIDSLMNGNFDVTEQSKYDITKILTVVLGLLAYMHPFIIHFVEIMQPNKNTDLDKYYKKKDQYEKPYGITRVMQKIFFTPWRGRDPRSDNAVKYAPIVRFYIFWTLIVFGFNYYKLRINNQEVFEKAEYTNFPTIYRYGIPEYQFLKHIPWLPLSVSIMSYFVCNVWIYILYNETDDFIICFGKNICCCCCTCDGRSKYICCVPVKDIMETEENTDEHRWMLKASKKLIFRFTMLFCLRFWRFIFTYSFCSVGTANKEKNENWPHCIGCLCHNVFIGTFLFFVNILVNILFCSMPAIWFIFFLIVSIFSSSKSGDTENDVNDERPKQLSQIDCTQSRNKISENGKEEHNENDKDKSTEIHKSEEKDKDNDKEEKNKILGTVNTENENQSVNERSTSQEEKAANGNKKSTKSKRSSNGGRKSKNDREDSIEHLPSDITASLKQTKHTTFTSQDKNAVNGKEKSPESECAQSKRKDPENIVNVSTENTENVNRIENTNVTSAGESTEKLSQSECQSRDEDPENDKEKINKNLTSGKKQKVNSCCSFKCFCVCLLQIFLLLVYVLTVREHASFFVFVERSFAYTIIAGLTVSDHVWRWYLVFIFSFGYFATYISEFLDSYAVLLDTIFDIHETNMDQSKAEEKRDESSNSRNSIDEDLFDYIVDNCYTARKRFFFLVIKTFITTIFMVVSFQILNKTGRFDEMKFFNETLSILVILISPKLVLIFTENKPADEIHKHLSEIEKLYKNYFEKSKNEKFEGDLFFKSFKCKCKDIVCSSCCKCSNCCKCDSPPFCCKLLFQSLCNCSSYSSNSDPLFSLSDIRKLQEDNTKQETSCIDCISGVCLFCYNQLFVFYQLLKNSFSGFSDRDEQHPMTDFENPREHDNTSVKTFSVDGTENGTEDKKCKNRPQGQDKFKVPHLKGQTKKSICSDPTEATPLIN